MPKIRTTWGHCHTENWTSLLFLCGCTWKAHKRHKRSGQTEGFSSFWKHSDLLFYIKYLQISVKLTSFEIKTTAVFDLPILSPSNWPSSFLAVRQSQRSDSHGTNDMAQLTIEYCSALKYCKQHRRLHTVYEPVQNIKEKEKRLEIQWKLIEC